MRVRLWLTVLMVILLLPVWATQRYVGIELFSETCTGCGGDYSSARSALIQLYAENEFVVPLIWRMSDPQSPGGLSRSSYYGSPVIPTAFFDGASPYEGEDDVVNIYYERYQSALALSSSFGITSTLGITGDGVFTLSTTVSVEQAFTASDPQVLLALTLHDDTNWAAWVVDSAAAQPLTITQVGETQTFTAELDFDPQEPLDRYKAVILVQDWTDSAMLQAGITGITDLIPDFSANRTSGPPSLGVYFEDLSHPQDLITSWQWDLDGDGETDSTDPEPYFLYDTPGAYDVSLTISDGTSTQTITHPAFIEVGDTQDIAGTVNGVWRPEHGVYQVSGDLTIPFYGALTIEPGTRVEFGYNTKFSVFGLLETGQTGAEPVTLTSASGWKGLKFINSAQPNRIENTIIENSFTCPLSVNGSTIAVIESRLIDNNTTTFSSGIDLLNSTQVELTGNLIAGNTSSSSAAAISLRNTQAVIAGNIIVNNTGLSAVHVRDGSVVELTGNTIANNATGYGYVQVDEAQATLTNNILWGDGTMIGNTAGNLDVSWSLIAGGYPDGSDILDTDPLFVSPTSGSGTGYDYMDAVWLLLPDSPAIDAGNPDPAYNDPEDPASPGNALYPAMGTVRADLGAYGGGGTTIGVGIDEDGEDVAPPVTALRVAAWPNPFNPRLSIRLELPANQGNRNVRVDVCNIRGQKIKTLIDKKMNGDTIDLEWDATDSYGKTVSSGVYFIRAYNETENVAHKVLLLK